MRWRQLRIVTLDLAVHTIWMLEEEEVVNRHDLRGVPGRNEQRMRRVHDIDRTAEGLDRRPLDTVPQIVEHRHRHAAVNDTSAQFPRERRCGSILP